MKAQKANKMVSIPESQKEKYLQMGWTILDDNEKIIAQPKRGDAELKTEIEALNVVNAQKDKEIQALQAEIAELTKKLSKKSGEEKADKTQK